MRSYGYMMMIVIAYVEISLTPAQAGSYWVPQFREKINTPASKGMTAQD